MIGPKGTLFFFWDRDGMITYVADDGEGDNWKQEAVTPALWLLGPFLQGAATVKTVGGKIIQIVIDIFDEAA